MSGKELLNLGEKLREEGRTFEALDKLNQSLDAFAQENDYSGFAHAILSRAICWQHLYQFHDNHLGFATLYKHDAEAMLEIVKAKNITEEEALAFFMNAKAAGIFNDYTAAVGLFKTALERMAPGRNAQKGDWRTNLGKALYFSGKKDEGVTEVLAGIEDIKKYASEVDDYSAKVWISGGYMRLAEMLAKDNPAESQKSLQQARQIIADPRLTVRQKQLESFLRTGKTGL